MKDIVVKTVLITLASVFGVFLLAYGALAIFSPLTLATIFDGTGGYSVSINFYERHYEKTGEIEDLAVLSLKINQDIDAPLAEKYLEELISHEGFDEFCANEEGEKLSNKEFYYGKYAVALVKNTNFDKAMEVSEKFVKENGYTEYSPFSVILIEHGEMLSSAQLDVIKEKIQLYSGEEPEKASTDLEYIEFLKSKI